jgi:hypothetical protein
MNNDDKKANDTKVEFVFIVVFSFRVLLNKTLENISKQINRKAEKVRRWTRKLINKNLSYDQRGLL